MEIITLDGYTDEEKVAIARDHLLARQLERNGLTARRGAVTDEALATLVADYTREAGVRGLERQLGKVLRKAATADRDRPTMSRASEVVIDVDDLRPGARAGPASTATRPTARRPPAWSTAWP